MADTKNQGGLSAVATTTDGGIGGLMRSLTPLHPENIEDNTLSSLLELSRTCEALQQKNSASQTPPPTEGCKAISPKGDHNGALLNNVDIDSEGKSPCPKLQSLKVPQSGNTLESTAQCHNQLIPSRHSSSLSNSDTRKPMNDMEENDLDDEDDDDDDVSSGEDEDDYEAGYNKLNIAMSNTDSLQLLRTGFNSVAKSPQDYTKYNRVSQHSNKLSFNNRASSNFAQEFEDESLSDGERFDGKIVYNPDGSAYIIEGESELSDTESLLDVPKLEGSIVDHRGKPATSQMPSFPQIANAFYIHKNPSTFYNNYFMFPENRPKPVAPIMHSFKVYDLRTQKAEQENMNSDKDESKEKIMRRTQLSPVSSSEEITAVPTKPILMCFICKLSFGYTKSFMAHAVGEHNMSLIAEEREIMSRKNASAIIQGVGKEKDPLMSFLEPTSSPAVSCSSDAQSVPRPYLPPPLFNASVGTSVGSTTSNTSVSYVYSNAKVTPIEHISKENKHSSENCGKEKQLAKGEDSISNCVSLSSPSTGSNPQIRLSTDCSPKGATYSSQTSDPDQPSGAMVMPQSPASSPRVSSRPSHQWTLPSPQKDSRGNSPRYHSPTVGDNRCTTPKKCPPEDNEALYRPFDSESPKSRDSESDVRKFSDNSMLTSPYKSPANEAYHPAMSSPVSGSGSSHSAITQSSPNGKQQAMSMSPCGPISTSSPQMEAGQPPPGIVIRSGCEDHPQGNISGVECPKCDLILGSSRSLGGHMTMMHSRNSCKTLKCPKCNWHYKYQETLEIHMKEKHPENDTQCIYCLTSQPHPRLARGEVYTCGYKPYRCEVCNYSTTTKGNLSIHMQSDKHINNMQEIQNGTVPNTEVKMPPSQPPPPPPPPLTPDPKKKKVPTATLR